MPQTKKQEIVYTIMMVCVMVYGMVWFSFLSDSDRPGNEVYAWS